MREKFLKKCGAVCLGGFVLACSMGGCGEPVREDRTITFSGGGDNVGFQHGDEGVFVADKEGKRLEKIFEPGEDVLATSTPLWSPVDERLIFTTAQTIPEPESSETPSTSSGEETSELAPREAVRVFAETPPEGNVYLDVLGMIEYTCWLRGEPGDEGPPSPKALFSATCDHAGYVAANLAVRWRPSGDAILYLDAVEPGESALEADDQQQQACRLSLFEYQIDSGKTRRVIPLASADMIFDFAPSGGRLACVLGGNDDPNRDGIWISTPGTDDWWHVPESASLVNSLAYDSVLEDLQAARPVWSPDGERFVYSTFVPAESDEETGRFSLRLATVDTHSIVAVLETEDPLRDVHWSPDGEQLGMIGAGGSDVLTLLRPGEEPRTLLEGRPVRRFAGWSAGGGWLAYVVVDDPPKADERSWAFLLRHDPLARDAVLLADGSGADPGREIFRDMRVTFPHWSPRDEKLSLWVTFTPNYRSWLSRWLQWGLLPGDPAAVFDTQTNELSWMAINAHEKLQIGHYHLARGEYEKAWQWYEEAEREMPPEESRTLEEFVANLTSPRDAMFFEYHCLKKLGRDDEAAEKLAEFRQRFLTAFPQRQAPADAPADANQAEDSVRELLVPGGLLLELLENLYAAEVFLSVNSPADASIYFQESLAAADSANARLASSVTLSQILLIQEEHGEYADLVAGTIAPLLAELWEPGANMPPADGLNAQSTLLQTGLMTIRPMFSPRFLATLTEDQVGTLTAAAEDLEMPADDSVGPLCIDLFLRAAYERLERPAQQQDAVRNRIERNPARSWLIGQRSIEDFVDEQPDD